ncbi:MAG: UDP-N-acetylmuramate dehydrogenase [Chitinophagales bacterium]|nr:UDP-N-acetylmuramate dehydrogenase [Chitinophagaceae bacterium]MCB9063938.1 UDP-N-acetylmuramate dehydrogenase [Chitinophagales bacterium]
MQVQQNISLLPYNTFGIDAKAEQLLVVTDKAQLAAIANNSTLPKEKHIIGGGSNILLTHDVPGLTLLNQLKGIELIKEDDAHVWVQVASGEVWHEFVLYAIDHDWGGVENLSLIPGTVGAAPMQNIGAYGVEAKEVIETVTAWHWEEQKFLTYTNEECHFGYRDSIFKHELKEKVFITDVVFKLDKEHSFNTNYGAIQQELDSAGVKELSIKAISNAVIAIRSSKLPNPKEIGNAGSFFKNPVIAKEHFEQLLQEHPEIPHYPVDDTNVKVLAGWLIEQCQFKGIKRGHTGVHEKQALVLVNRGGANGQEVWELSEEILQTVHSKFGIMLEREVQIW